METTASRFRSRKLKKNNGELKPVWGSNLQRVEEKTLTVVDMGAWGAVLGALIDPEGLFSDGCGDDLPIARRVRMVAVGIGCGISSDDCPAAGVQATFEDACREVGTFLCFLHWEEASSPGTYIKEMRREARLQTWCSKNIRSSEIPQ